MAFNWSLYDNKYPKISKTLLNILADFSTAAARIILILPLISCWPSDFSRFLKILLSAPDTIVITVTFIFHIFFLTFCKCYILTLDRAVNQRWTRVNKRKKKRKQVGVMKYRQMPAAVDSVGSRKARVRTSLQTENPPRRAVGLSYLRLSNPSQDAEEVPSGFLKITQRREEVGSIYQSVPVSTNLSHTSETSTLSSVSDIFL